MELQHHGILGQKWGKRNGPPYPLSASKYSSMEKKLNKRLSRLDRKIEKIDSRQLKANKYQRKADAKKYGLFSNQEKAQKYQSKASEKQYKINKQRYSVTKEIDKIVKNYDQKYPGLFDIPDSYIDAGKRYAQLLNARTISSL